MTDLKLLTKRADILQQLTNIRSVGKKVDCNIDAKCYDVQSFNSSKRYSMWNIIASSLFS